MSRFDWRELHYAASFRLSSPAWRIAGPPQGWAVDPQLLLPAGAGLVVEQVRLCDEIVRVTVRCAAAGANGPGCGSWSEAFHSGYKRNLGDLPIAGRQAVVDLWVRRFRCYRPECPRKTFVEQAPVLAERLWGGKT